MIGVSKVDFGALISRVQKQEDMVGSLQPRVASLEFHIRCVDSSIATMDRRMETHEGHMAGSIAHNNGVFVSLLPYTP